MVASATTPRTRGRRMTDRTKSPIAALPFTTAAADERIERVADALDRSTQGREIRKLVAAPDFMLGSVQAVTDDGALVVVSYSGSQIGPYSGGAGRVILVVGSQKIVADLDEGLRRVREHVLPYEDARLQAQLGVPTKLAKL